MSICKLGTINKLNNFCNSGLLCCYIHKQKYIGNMRLLILSILNDKLNVKIHFEVKILTIIHLNVY